MRISKMGMKNVKLSNLDEMYPAQDILFQTNQVKQYGSGVYAYDNIPLKVQDNIEEVIKNVLIKQIALKYKCHYYNKRKCGRDLDDMIIILKKVLWWHLKQIKEITV